MIVHVEVTAEDIEAGRAPSENRCCTCPIALALARVIGETAHVGPGCIGYQRDGGPIVDTPGEVLDWMCDFDDGRHVEPFAFDIELPEVTP